MPGPLALRDAPPEAGAKAHNLGRMLRAGLRVPEGFCVLDPSCGILAAWRELQAPRVAVRSSSLTEDGQSGSAAGQFETALNVEEAELVACVQRIGASLRGSVIVQPMVEARVAGVVFTRDPTSAVPCVRVEAAPGLGAALVSGHTRPAAWRCHPDGRHELLDGPACLTAAELEALLAAARQAQSLWEAELDLEFAFDSGPEPWLLQARPITASQDLREQLRRGEIEKAQALSVAPGTVWSGSNVAETLPAPLPMSWSVVQRMLSLRGAYGRLYPELGYDPDPGLQEIGVVDLICGRPYLNLSRSARMFFRDFPLVFRLEELRADPRRAASPQPRLDLKSAQPGFWRRLPATLVKIVRAQFRLEREKSGYPRRFTQEVLPAFLARIRALSREDLRALDSHALLERFQQLLVLVVDEFASQSLKASAFAALALAAHGNRPLPPARPAPEADLTGLLLRASGQEITFEELLEAMGHRGPCEMELAEPRWREVPERLRGELEKVRSRQAAPPGKGPLADWLSLRETARHWLMLGWAELRRTLLALDERLGLQGGVFWLHYDELTRPDPALIARRRLHRRLLLSLPCPSVLFSDDLEAIGRPPQVEPARALSGTPLSFGSAEGSALVVRHPQEVPLDATGYVLVCPSTDPGYTLAMSRAVALVVETGGVLSHGAIVARELGLPAVSNVCLEAIENGSRLRVDGGTGRVTTMDGTA